MFDCVVVADQTDCEYCDCRACAGLHCCTGSWDWGGRGRATANTVVIALPCYYNAMLDNIYHHSNNTANIRIYC